MTTKITIGILIAFIALLIAWDIWVYLEPTPGDTISEVTLRFAQRHPVLPAAIGVLVGHLLWPQRTSG